MTDEKLRSAMIRLAHEKPELRAELLPLLVFESKTGKSAWGAVRVPGGKQNAVEARKGLERIVCNFDLYQELPRGMRVES